MKPFRGDARVISSPGSSIPAADAVVSARGAEYLQLRDDLSRALESIQALPDTGESWLTDARTAFADEMVPGRSG